MEASAPGRNQKHLIYSNYMAQADVTNFIAGWSGNARCQDGSGCPRANGANRAALPLIGTLKEHR